MSKDLLPSNATPFERNLSLMSDRIFDVPVIVKEVWNANTAPVDVLPWLAWALSVDDWDTNWTEEQKRNVIRNAPATQKIKGTLGAVQLQLASIGIDVQIQEWFNQVPEGAPYTYILHVNVDQFPLNQTTLQKIISLIESTKNVRSHMATAKINVKSVAHGYAVAVARTGHNIRITGTETTMVVASEFNVPNITITQ